MVDLPQPGHVIVNVSATSSTMADIDLHSLLGSNPLSPELGNYIAFVVTKASLDQPVPSPEIKSYSDAVYFNYHKLGLSLQFAPMGGYKPSSGLKQNELKNGKLSLDSIYLYNTCPRENRNSSFSTHPVSPLMLKLNPDVKGKDGNLLSRPSTLEVHSDMSGKDFVKALLEPDRKGGGTGPSSGSIGIWCEWSKDGIMVEFGGVEAKGPQAWERGKDAVWKIITIFTVCSQS